MNKMMKTSVWVWMAFCLFLISAVCIEAKIRTANVNEEDLFDCIVVGGGFAGLAAARILKDGGQKVVVLEARDVYGGRVNTFDMGGMTVEAGAQWVDGWHSNSPTQNLAEFVGVPSIPFNEILNEPNVEVPVYDSDIEETFPWSSIYSQVEGFTTWSNLQKTKKAAGAGANMVAGAEAYITKFGLNDSEAKFLRSAVRETLCESYYAGAPHKMSLAAFWEDKEFFNNKGGGASRVLPDGHGQLADELAKTLDIRLNTPVTEVDYTESNVKVTVSSGQTFTGRKVVVAVPLAVLKIGTITFKPALPASKQTAINNLGVGTLEKVILKFETNFWNNDGLYYMKSGDRSGTFVYLQDLTAVSGFPSLVAWHGGDISTATLDAMPNDEDVVNALLREMSEILGPDVSVPQPTGYYVSRWQYDPYIGGSYSYVAVGSTPEDMNEIAQPLDDKVYFAGEHTQPKFYGQTHGALLSGEEAALDIAPSSKVFYWSW